MFTKNNALKLLVASAGIALLAACTPAATPPQPQATATQAVAQPAEQQAAQPAEAAPQTSAQTATENVIKKINLNTASAEEFVTIPDVGNRMVREFNEYRPYSSIQQFRKEIGKYVDAAQVAAYENYLFVPVAPNEADAATLQQLPGVDAAVAEQLIAGRPYASKADFIKKLGELVSAEQLAIGEGYVEGE